MTAARWIIGLGVSLVAGELVTWGFLLALRKYLKVPDQSGSTEHSRPIPGWLTGTIERGFFTTMVAFNVSGAAVGMIGWLTLKMVTDWNRPGGNPPDIEKTRGALASLLAGLVSMLFATAGGMICRGAG